MKELSAFSYQLSAVRLRMTAAHCLLASQIRLQEGYYGGSCAARDVERSGFAAWKHFGRVARITHLDAEWGKEVCVVERLRQ